MRHHEHRSGDAYAVRHWRNSQAIKHSILVVLDAVDSLVDYAWLGGPRIKINSVSVEAFDKWLHRGSADERGLTVRRISAGPGPAGGKGWRKE